MEESFRGKRVLVTGGGRGIGRHLCVELAKYGAQVIAISKTQERLSDLQKEVPSIKVVTLDVSSWQTAERVVERLLPVDYLVNNAGVAVLQPVGNITEDEFEKTFAVNVKAALNLSQVVAKDLKRRRKSGSIVNVSSQASLVALQDHTVYCASKAALDQITKCLALELGPHKIRVNSVNPTVVMTEMAKVGWGDPAKANAMKSAIPLRKFCDTQDVVDAVMFLLSDKAAMITGACLPIDGGYTIH